MALLDMVGRAFNVQQIEEGVATLVANIRAIHAETGEIKQLISANDEALAGRIVGCERAIMALISRVDQLAALMQQQQRRETGDG